MLSCFEAKPTVSDESSLQALSLLHHSQSISKVPPQTMASVAPTSTLSPKGSLRDFHMLNTGAVHTLHRQPSTPRPSEQVSPVLTPVSKHAISSSSGGNKAMPSQEGVLKHTTIFPISETVASNQNVSSMPADHHMHGQVSTNPPTVRGSAGFLLMTVETQNGNMHNHPEHERAGFMALSARPPFTSPPAAPVPVAAIHTTLRAAAHTPNTLAPPS